MYTTTNNNYYITKTSKQKMNLQTAIQIFTIDILNSINTCSETNNHKKLCLLLKANLQKHPYLFLQDLNDDDSITTNTKIKSHELFHMAQDLIYDPNHENDDANLDLEVIQLIAAKVCHCAVVYACDEIKAFVFVQDNHNHIVHKGYTGSHDANSLRWKRVSAVCICMFVPFLFDTGNQFFFSYI